MAEKRTRPYDNSGSGRGGRHQPFKKHKPNDYDTNRHSYSTGNGPDRTEGRIRGGSYATKNPVADQISRLPDPNKCHPCKLAAAEVQTGLIALLDKLVQEEAGTKGGEGIVHHARGLHALLAARAEKALPSSAKRDLDSKRPEKENTINIPAYVAHKLEQAKPLAPLPPITEPYLQEAVFTHYTANHTLNAKGFNPNDINYDRLEFLGDAYIEVIASRLIYSRFPDHEVPAQSYLREQLVRNETLAHFSTAYALGDRLKHGAHLQQSKGWTKILADVFEAYVAAIILADPDTGYTTAEAWLTELWTPQLLAYKVKPVENPRARDDLNKLVMAKNIKLEYRQERDMVMVNGVQKYCIGVYLTGWGFENEWLGTGEGQNKSQACVFAAMDALKNRKKAIEEANKKKLELYPPKTKEEIDARKEANRVEKEAEKAKKEVEGVKEEGARKDDAEKGKQEKRLKTQNKEESDDSETSSDSDSSVS